MTEQYYAKMRRTVHVTPKSYLFFLKDYKRKYEEKYSELEEQEKNFNKGLEKIKEAKKDIQILEDRLKIKNEELRIQQAELEKDVEALRKKTDIALNKEKQVLAEKTKIEGEKVEIEAEKSQCEAELKLALPALLAAETAAKKIDSAATAAFKKFIANKDCPAVVKYITDAMNIILYQAVRNDIEIKEGIKAVKKDVVGYTFLGDSWEICKSSLNNTRLKDELIKRALKGNEDLINDEILELVEPYIDITETMLSYNNVETVAQNVLIIREWIVQIDRFSKNTRIVKPKKAAVKQQEEKLQKAMNELAKKEQELQEVKKEVETLNQGLRAKKALADEKEEEAKMQKNKIKKATKLITSLVDEEQRWSSDANELAVLKNALVGNVAVATAFISYCGPFNAEFRDTIANELMIKNLRDLNIPFTNTIYQKLTAFLVDDSIVGQWNLDGLPKDNLSTQNGIMVESSERYPLLIDPQAQGSTWIKNMYNEINPDTGRPLVTIISSMEDKKFRDCLINCMDNGEVMIIEGIVSEVDPFLDPILEKQHTINNKGKIFIKIGEEKYDLNPNFKLFLTCKLGNPTFSPELSAKTTIIDFTVTRIGLQQQLLSLVLSREMKVLEEQLNNLIRKVTERTKQLKLLDKELLEKLSTSTGNLIDDDELVEILNRTKTEAKDIAV
jgi:dynein heavy chain, axonemal